jgi:hypothetical protein
MYLGIPGHDLQVSVGQPKERALAVAREIAPGIWYSDSKLAFFPNFASFLWVE